MIRRLGLVLGMALSMPAGAEEAPPPLSCSGVEPEWTLEIEGATGVFAFGQQSFDYEIPQHSRAENRDWPVAVTLLDPLGRSTAILVADQAECGDQAFRAHVLTQRSVEPILLTGCCRLPE